MAMRNQVKKYPLFWLDVHTCNSKTKSVKPHFFCWIIIGIQPLNFQQLSKKLLGSGFRATLILLSKILLSNDTILLSLSDTELFCNSCKQQGLKTVGSHLKLERSSHFLNQNYLAIKLLDWFIESHISLGNIMHALVLAFISAIPPKDRQVQRQLARVFIKVASSFALVQTHAKRVTLVSQ